MYRISVRKRKGVSIKIHHTENSNMIIRNRQPDRETLQISQQLD